MMFSDLTQINVPFGLLDPETQEALKAHGGPFEVFAGREWGKPYSQRPNEFAIDFAYRVKPTPATPREWWITGGNCAWSSRAEAEANCDYGDIIIHAREVHPPAPPQPRTIYLCETSDGLRFICKNSIDATRAALAHAPGATVSEWREVL